MSSLGKPPLEFGKTDDSGVPCHGMQRDMGFVGVVRAARFTGQAARLSAFAAVPHKRANDAPEIKCENVGKCSA